jgi:hypothetical protein
MIRETAGTNKGVGTYSLSGIASKKIPFSGQVKNG